LRFAKGHRHAPEVIAKLRAASSTKRTTLPERFWARVRKGAGCWSWTGTVARVGYGVIGRGSRQEGLAYSHRLAYVLLVGPIPEGLYVLHKCDNRRCVRPDHLFLGTHLDNVADMVRKGRHRYGRAAR
jgi:hypothetical protein